MEVKIMKNLINRIIVGLLLIAIFGMTLFVKSPEEITSMLLAITNQLKLFSVIVHIIFLAIIAAGLIYKKFRNVLFFTFIAFLSISATIIGVMYLLLPNIIIFGMFFVLILNAYRNKKLNFNLEKLEPISIFFGIIGMIGGFWYLHWVENPIWLNALFYSPLGSINCPTMLTVCAFLCLTEKPRSRILENVVGLITLFFGFFGIFRLGAYIDIVLVVCSLFLLVRSRSCMAYENAFKKIKN